MSNFLEPSVWSRCGALWNCYTSILMYNLADFVSVHSTQYLFPFPHCLQFSKSDHHSLCMLSIRYLFQTDVSSWRSDGLASFFGADEDPIFHCIMDAVHPNQRAKVRQHFSRSAQPWTMKAASTSLLLLFAAGAATTEAFVSRSNRPFSAHASSSTTVRVPSAASYHSKTTTTTTPLHLLPPVQELMESTSTVVNHANNALSSSVVLSTLMDNVAAPPETAGISYSKASYYTVLGLYLMSFPGLWSQIKRSTKAKVKRKTYVSPGEKAATGGDEKAMSLRQQAGEIMACE